MGGGNLSGRGVLMQRTGAGRPKRRRQAYARRLIAPPTRRSARPRAPPRRPAARVRAWGVEARAKGSYSSPTRAYGLPTPRLRPPSAPPPPVARPRRARPLRARRRPWRACAAQPSPRAPGGSQRALQGATGHLLRTPTAHLRNAYALLARRRRLPRAPAARAHAARGAPPGAPVPPSQARARLVGCSAR